VKIAKKREIPLDYTIAAEKLSTGKSQNPKPPMHRAEAADEVANAPPQHQTAKAPKLRKSPLRSLEKTSPSG